MSFTRLRNGAKCTELASCIAFTSFMYLSMVWMFGGSKNEKYKRQVINLQLSVGKV